MRTGEKHNLSDLWDQTWYMISTVICKFVFICHDSRPRDLKIISDLCPTPWSYIITVYSTPFLLSCFHNIRRAKYSRTGMWESVHQPSLTLITPHPWNKTLIFSTVFVRRQYSIICIPYFSQNTPVGADHFSLIYKGNFALIYKGNCVGGKCVRAFLFHDLKRKLCT